jgi:hypothetical protein
MSMREWQQLCEAYAQRAFCSACNIRTVPFISFLSFNFLITCTFINGGDRIQGKKGEKKRKEREKKKKKEEEEKSAL